MLLTWIKRYWFLSALLATCLITITDGSGILAGWGKWLKTHRGPDLVMVLIFFFSGFALSPEQQKQGALDVGGTLLAFAVIFIAAPLLAILFSRLPMDTGIVIGLFLVAVMPSTLSSGVVMTAAAGGRPAHALVITITANVLSIFTIPYALPLLLTMIGQSAVTSVDKAAIMIRIGILMVSPLATGMVCRHLFSSFYNRLERDLTHFNQGLIVFVVWIAMSQTHAMLIGSGPTVVVIILMVFAYHALLLLCGWGLIQLAGRDRGQRESVLLMGCQKTLPLSVILQMSLFPHYGIALLVCVLHHLVHLMMDGYLVERLRRLNHQVCR